VAAWEGGSVGGVCDVSHFSNGPFFLADDVTHTSNGPFFLAKSQTNGKKERKVVFHARMRTDAVRAGPRRFKGV